MLPPSLCDLIDAGPLAFVSTVGAQGGPHVTAMWIGRDSDQLFTVHMRLNQKVRNMRRDPRVAMTFAPPVTGEWLTPYVVIDATATIERTMDAWPLMSRLAAIYVGPDAALPGGSEPGYVVRYSVDRIGGTGPWAEG